jgi:hypothetical protein
MIALTSPRNGLITRINNLRERFGH